MKIDKNNGCIYVLAGRLYMIEECIERFFDYYNTKFNFPFYIYYFDNLFDKNKKNIKIANKLSQKYKIKFVNIKTSIPNNVSYKDLFFNKDYSYVKKSFGPERINYLHMCHFFTNTNNKPELDKYRFHHRIDDDVFLQKNIDDNLFEVMNSQNYKLATSKLWNQIKPSTYDTRQGLFEFYKSYLGKNNLIPLNPYLEQAVNLDDDDLFHKLHWSTGHFNIYDQKYLKDHPNWNAYIDYVNSSGGIYKYRWGDFELIGLFLYTFFENPKLDLKLDKGGYITAYSKGTKVLTTDNLFQFYLKKIYRKLRYQILTKLD
tara:strand:- start:369 stop:1313 length:945 start_codon:yes stop_codon:yes gene_type:complete